MKKRLLFLKKHLLAGLLIISGIGAKAQKPPTIYQSLGLQPNGCLLPAAEVAASQQAVFAVEVPKPPTPGNSAGEDPVEALQALIDSGRPFFANAVPLLPPTVLPLKDGGSCFLDHGHWGVRNAVGTAILKPTFDRVLVDTAYAGFVGYREDRCNYYAADGRKQLKADYFHVRPTPTGDFIVQTEKGFGILRSDGRYLLEPGFFQIGFFSEQGQFYYLVSSSKFASFLLTSEGKSLGFNTGGTPPRVIDERYLSWGGQLIDVREGRRIVCEETHYVEVLDEERRLASVLDQKTQQAYLIHFDGRLVLPSPFQRINHFNGAGLAVATVNTVSTDGFNRRRTLSGLIDQAGTWLIQPVYSYLYSINDTVFVGKDEFGKHRLIDAHNEPLCEGFYHRISKANEQLLLLVQQENRTIHSELFDLRSRKVVRSDLPYSAISPIRHCNGQGYIAEQPEGEIFLGADFEPLFPRPYSRVFYHTEGWMKGTDFDKGGVRKISQFYTCEGEPLQLEIDGRVVDRFVEHLPLTNGLSYVFLEDGAGYFIGPEGPTTRNEQQWNSIFPAKSGDLSLTMRNGQYGLIDGRGQTIFPPDFPFLGPFDPETGLAQFQFRQGLRGYLTSEGDLLFGAEYRQVLDLGMGLFKVEKDGKWGVVGRAQQNILPPAYDSIERHGGLLLAFSKAGRQWFTLSGKAVGN